MNQHYPLHRLNLLVQFSVHLIFHFFDLFVNNLVNNLVIFTITYLSGILTPLPYLLLEHFSVFELVISLDSH